MRPQELEILEKHTQALIEHARAIKSQSKPNTPLDRTPWDAEECAGFLRVELTTFRNVYAPCPSFPRAIKADTISGRGHPRWNAQEVIDWFFAHGEETAKRRRSRKSAE